MSGRARRQGRSIVLIGMPVAGKSTVGVILAKHLGVGFVDTDFLIQGRAGRRLQEIVDGGGFAELRRLEEEAILGIGAGKAVIATGGSAVYSALAMEHLARLGTLVYLRAGLGLLESRIDDYDRRGIANPSGGVTFMAESAAILSPDKIVLTTEMDALCPMADMIRVSSPRPVRKEFPGFENPPPFIFPRDFSLMDIKRKYPGVPVVAYVNTTADVKAESYICYTSANVVKVVDSLPDEKVICIPDKNLSLWEAKNTRKEIIAWDGFCHVHERVSVGDVTKARAEHPEALFMAHPECWLEVLETADHVTSTSGMLRFAKTSSEKEFIVGTEIGLLYRLRKENPDKVFYPLRETWYVLR